MARQPSGTGSAKESADAPAEAFDSSADAQAEAVTDQAVTDEDFADDEPVGDELADDELADGIGAEADEDTEVDDDELDEDFVEEPTAVRSPETDAFWTDVRVQPVEIALTAGVGYTLRAYRLATDVREPEIVDREDDFPVVRVLPDLDPDDIDPADLPAIDEAELTAQALAAGEDSREDRVDDEVTGSEDDTAEPRDPDAAVDERVETDPALGAPVEVTGLDTDDEVDDGVDDVVADVEEPAEPEDVPIFLSLGGKLLLFRTPEGLVEYVRGADNHELTQLDTWHELRDRVRAEDIVALDEDRYELDLVVENLRGGHDVWDPALIIQSGEVARDIGFALRLPKVIAALAPGSPLDDLDEGLRTVEAGGLGSFFARRKLRRIDPQTTAALGWRTIIGKISAVVDWRN
ncbi:MAG: hypothetical protein QOI74_1068 [Micromonosporaceae bacterium]|nr:hypothetical protein [Micromonosporaceae bacterium]